VKAPRQPPAPVGKGIGKAATIRRASAGAPTKRVHALPPDGAQKSRTEPPSPAPQSGKQLHTADGIRKYLTAVERDAFLREAEMADRPVRTLCMTLAYAGCRLSEALALTAEQVDLAAGVLVCRPPGSKVCRPRPKGCGMVSGWPPLPPGSRST
jgi:integrase